MLDASSVSLGSPCTTDSRTDPAAPKNMLGRYNDAFLTLRAQSPEMVRTAQAIRYQVYCLERQFENADEYADHFECDAFDGAAIHNLLVYRPSSDAIGTARLILPRVGTGYLPVQQLLFQCGLRAEDYFPVDTMAEVSRFAISNAFRRRCNENLSAAEAGHKRETCSILPCLGLIQSLLRQSLSLGLTHWAAVMEPKLLRMLAAMGIHFTSVGPVISYHGLRQSSYCHLPQMLERLREERPDHWMVVTNDGELLPRGAPGCGIYQLAA